METETSRSNAPSAPGVVANGGMMRTSSATPQPATAEATKNFQTVATIGPTPKPIGLPAYQKAGSIRTKKDAVQGKAITKSPTVQRNSITPQRNHRSGRPLER